MPNKPEVKEFDAWNRIGLRAAYGQILLHMAEQGLPVFAVSADLGRSSGLDRFVARFPEQYLGVGIAEQNLVGVAAGLSETGLSVFASSFAPFLTARAGDQVRMNLGYMQSPVTLVGLASGLSLGFLGSSHYGLEDLAVMRAIPGIEIVSPSDSEELYSVLVYATSSEKPLYIRLTGSSALTSVSSQLETAGMLQQPQWLVKPTAECAVIASGVTVAACKEVIDGQESLQGGNVGLMRANWLRPSHLEIISQYGDQLRKIFVFEEHSIRGGLGTEILHTISKNRLKDLEVSIFGIGEAFPHGFSYEYGLANVGLSHEGIRDSILRTI